MEWCKNVRLLVCFFVIFIVCMFSPDFAVVYGEDAVEDELISNIDTPEWMNRIEFSAEQVLEKWANGYIGGITPGKNIVETVQGTTYEQVADGLDYELGTLLPYIPWLKLYGASVSTTVAANQARCTINVPVSLDDPTPDTLPETLTVKDGILSHIIRISFDVDNAIQESAGNTLFPAQPTVTMTMTALK